MPSCQSTAFGDTGHTLTQIPHLTHFSDMMQGLGTRAFLIVLRLLLGDKTLTGSRLIIKVSVDFI